MHVLQWVYFKLASSASQLFSFSSHSDLRLSLAELCIFLDSLGIEFGVRVSSWDPSSKDLDSTLNLLWALTLFISQSNHLGEPLATVIENLLPAKNAFTDKD